jgi:hypothetical protein
VVRATVRNPSRSAAPPTVVPTNDIPGAQVLGAAGFMDEAGRSRDEGAAAGMGRAPVQAKVPIRALEPEDDAERSHRATSLGSNHVSRPPGRRLPPSRKGIGQCGVHRNQPTTALLGRDITQCNGVADLTTCVEHHVPGQACDLAGAQAGFCRQQNHHAVAEWMTAAIGEGEQIRQLARSKDLGLFAEHVTHPELSNKLYIDLITNTMRLQRLFVAKFN